LGYLPSPQVAAPLVVRTEPREAVVAATAVIEGRIGLINGLALRAINAMVPTANGSPHVHRFADR